MKWILTFIFITSLNVFAVVQQSEGTCLLLKQQVAQYSNNKTHKNYRESKRMVDTACINPKKAKSSNYIVSETQKFSAPKIKGLIPQVKQSNSIQTLKLNQKVADKVDMFSLFPFKILISLFVVFLLCISFSILLRVNSSKIKGMVAERVVNRKLNLLSNCDYKCYKNLILPLDDGDLTEVDHLVVSRFGIFVIETKNYAGWIFGSEKQPFWTQKIYKKKSKFQNPLHQNYKHCLAVGTLFGLAKNIESVVVFTERSEFKTKLPINVIKLRDLIRYIESFQTHKFGIEEVIEFDELLKYNIANTSRDDRKQHLNLVKKRRVEPKVYL